MSKIRILHIQETIGGGGVERRRLSLAKHLDKTQFEQKFICTFAKGNIPDEIRAEGFDVLAIGRLKSPFDWKQHRKVQKIIEEYQPDIIHGAVFEGVTMAAINGWLKNVPVIIIEETSDPQNRSWRANLLMKLFAVLADKVIGVSEGVTEEYLKGQLGLSNKKAIAITNGVALPREVNLKETNAAKIKWGIEESDFVIGSVGRMNQDSHKRFSDLIHAFALFSKGKVNIKLLLVGDGQERKNYEEQVAKLGIEDQVIFASYQSDVALFYQIMDVFALVSAREAFGLVLAEAMLNKLPVIATKVGGMKDIVDDGVTGFLVEPMDVASITDKMELLFQTPALLKEMGNSGFIKAKREYTESIYIKKIENLYLNIMNK